MLQEMSLLITMCKLSSLKFQFPFEITKKFAAFAMLGVPRDVSSLTCENEVSKRCTHVVFVL